MESLHPPILRPLAAARSGFPIGRRPHPFLANGKRITGLAVAAAALCLAGCRTPVVFDPVDTAAPGWIVRSGQAVWIPSPRTPAIAGDLLWAEHLKGDVWLEFSKAGLPLVGVRLSARAWELRIPMRRRVYTGRGDPPARSVWIVFARNLVGATPPSDWHVGTDSSGITRIERLPRGESLEVHLNPDGE